jgi:Diguanylate cyclase, GGDEF domain
MAMRLNAHQVQFGVTVSMGVAEASVSMSGIDALMGAADQALYQAKVEGRNRCIAWKPPAACKQSGGVSVRPASYSGTGTSNVFSVTETMQ